MGAVVARCPAGGSCASAATVTCRESLPAHCALGARCRSVCQPRRLRSPGQRCALHRAVPVAASVGGACLGAGAHPADGSTYQATLHAQRRQQPGPRPAHWRPMADHRARRDPDRRAGRGALPRTGAVVQGIVRQAAGGRPSLEPGPGQMGAGGRDPGGFLRDRAGNAGLPKGWKAAPFTARTCRRHLDPGGRPWPGARCSHERCAAPAPAAACLATAP